MSDITISTDRILYAAVQTLNNRKYRITGTSTTIVAKPEDLKSTGIYSVTPPHSLYRRAAILLSAIADNDSGYIARTFGVTEKFIAGEVKFVERALRQNTKLAEAFYGVAVTADIPLNWLPKKELLAPLENVHEKTAGAKPGASVSKVFAAVKNAAPAPKPQTPPPQTAKPEEDLSHRRIREVSIENVAYAALAAFNKFRGEDVMRADLNGIPAKGSTALEARKYVTWAILKCIPQMSCNMSDLGKFFDDNRPATHQMVFKGMKELVQVKDRTTFFIMNDVADRLNLSNIQTTYLKAANKDRILSWDSLHSTAQRNAAITGRTFPQP